ncbi:HTH-type transcriptional regulator KipR [Pigmentiphaga humi]|uniref:HTH-type transcriptional regulator KipR n=1 Tax=Pigmentiphaga humi TaxID=2478468 RepID=A0A3P4AY79_9BURK|nr:IclR family transcriptional regulator [Pigmentiphaga humi]VCU68380.1 HTH-type transcriptional regulator KipR [Pigmentiphaga humi]
MLALLDVFTPEEAVWSIEELIELTGTSPSTTYRYLKSLHRAGLLSRVGNGSYTLGPRILELDLTTRLTDPVFLAGNTVIDDLSARTQQSALLCILFSNTVMCVGTAYTADASPDLFRRGQRRPLFQGAAAKAILAWLPPHQLRSLFAKHADQIRAAGLGRDWTEFRQTLRGIREAGYSSSWGEFTPGVSSIAAPIFNGETNVLGSLALARRGRADPASMDQSVEQLKEAAQTISRTIASLSSAPAYPARGLSA